jgi:small nuclear ribonucleoprotein (snRNP)-like protein
MERMKHFVDTGTTVRVSVTDGRVFTGTLGCVDKQLNVVLINATETFKKKKKSKRGGKEKEKRENEEKEEENHETSSSRVINMALIAREHRVKMERLVEHQNEREMDEEKEKEEANKSLLESALESGLRIL